jgi:hypothetical protein
MAERDTEGNKGGLSPMSEEHIETTANLGLLRWSFVFLIAVFVLPYYTMGVTTVLEAFGHGPSSSMAERLAFGIPYFALCLAAAVGVPVSVVRWRRSRPDGARFGFLTWLAAVSVVLASLYMIAMPALSERRLLGIFFGG